MKTSNWDDEHATSAKQELLLLQVNPTFGEFELALIDQLNLVTHHVHTTAVFVATLLALPQRWTLHAKVNTAQARVVDLDEVSSAWSREETGTTIERDS